jgi:hypothetical protein
VQKLKLSTGKIYQHHTKWVQVPTKLTQSVPFFSKTAGRHIFEISIIKTVATDENSKASTLTKKKKMEFAVPFSV